MSVSISKPWPKGTASFVDLEGPICEAIRFAYKLERHNEDCDIPWAGLTLGRKELAGCPAPHDRLTRDNLEYDKTDQGRDALEVLVGIAVQLGIEQGRRMAFADSSESRGLSVLLARQVLQVEKRREKHER